MSDPNPAATMDVQPEEIVDVFDLDHTLLDTERLWFRPALLWLATYARLPQSVVDERFAECNRTTFTFEKLFAALKIGPSHWARIELELRAALSLRANRCLYPDVVEMLAARHRVARLALVTAGDEAWQRWKFDQLTALHPFFHPGDRHFVPLSGSKADRVALYRGASRVAFVDDSPRWLLETCESVHGVRLVRALMGDQSPALDHPGDGRHWDVACSAAEIHAILAHP